MNDLTLLQDLEMQNESSVPEWVPAPGTIVDISLDTLASKAAGVGKYQTRAIYDSWSGVTYFPWWGPYGTFVQTGGGHSSSSYNDIYAYSVADRTHAKIKTNAPIFEHADKYVADRVSGWMWADTTTNAVQVGEAFSAHMYAYGVAIPPGLISGDAPNGWLFTPGKYSIPRLGSVGTNQSHRIAVGLAQKWEAHGLPLTRSAQRGCAFFDSRRNKIVSVSDGPVKDLVMMDAITGQESKLTLDKSVVGYYHTGFYDAANDLYITVNFKEGVTPSVKLQIIDPNNGVVTLPVITGDLPAGSNAGGWDWVPEWKALVFYPGSGNAVWTLSSITSPTPRLLGEYNFERQTLTGAPTAVFSNLPHYSRFRYVPALKCFLWFSTVEHPVQAFGVSPPTGYVENPGPGDPQDPTGPIANIEVTSDIVGTDVPFTFGHAFKAGEVFDSAQIDGIRSQCNVLNRWDDGSIKFAVMTGVARFDGRRTFTLTSGSGSYGSPVTSSALTDKSLLIEVAGTTVDLATAENVQIRLSGPELTEYIASKAINEHMVALFCVRIYSTGDVWVRWTLHNGFLRVPGAKNFAYQLKVVAESSTLIDQAVDQKAQTRITGSCWLGRRCNVSVKHDLVYLNETKLVPNYGWRNPASSAFSWLSQQYTPMGRANLRSNFPATGYDDQIGLLPRWDALWLTTGDERAFRSVIANAESGASYSVHFLDEATLRVPRFSDHPDLTTGDTTMRYTGGRAYTHDLLHQPSIGYLAYLLTADPFFLQEVQHWATYNAFYMERVSRQRQDCVLRTQSRGIAWAMRTLATAAVITPDEDSLQTEFARSWAANMKYYVDRFVTGAQIPQRGGVNALGAIALYSGGTAGDPYHAGNAIWEDAPWMQHFLQSVLGFTYDLEIPQQSADERANHRALRDFGFKHVVGMLGDGVTGRPYQHAGMYEIPYGTTATLNELQSPIVHYPSWAAQWAAHKEWSTNRSWSSVTLTDPISNALLGTSGGNPATMSTGYWGNLHPAIALAVDAGVPGASEAYARLTQASNYASGAATFHDRPQFGLKPRVPN